MVLLPFSVLFCGLGLLANALPFSPNEAASMRVHDARSDAPITTPAELATALASLMTESSSSAAATLQDILNQITPAPAPSSISQLLTELQLINAANQGNIIAAGAEILLGGLAGGDMGQIISAYSIESSSDNSNPINPQTSIYPKADPSDAPYSVDEATLRAAIYMPSTFTYGRIPPVIFIPGTSTVAGQVYGANFGKLFESNKIADPVYLNIPGQNLGDVQVAAEYVAYATNYISAISGGKNVSTISFSQGSVDGQWALKYWPSVRAKMSNKISISPDYHGSTIAAALCPGNSDLVCTPALAQQQYNSVFIQTLRNNGGDSAYVPTTNIYTIYDEAVEPQTGLNASGYLLDARGVGVTNVEVQDVCSTLLPGGNIGNDHESLMFNALASTLTMDALQNGGPAQLGRVNTVDLCTQSAPAGMTTADVMATEAIAPLAIMYAMMYQPKVETEPPIMPYAKADTPS